MWVWVQWCRSGAGPRLRDSLSGRGASQRWNRWRRPEEDARQRNFHTVGPPNRRFRAAGTNVLASHLGDPFRSHEQTERAALPLCAVLKGWSGGGRGNRTESHVRCHRRGRHLDSR
ncbi:hypothetical protein AAFF_G00158310 [Aldrovandia affinis]|uniref:Uncharacterized protein n=1 Tax=Aldrovandia affinis TaxID=143900 RepID=A0AAD7RNH7_9TELE|nr:hypothetical protein AAFF_G00158310 [Aldrovandia affinis]